jgi:CYTH domain-containing protein
LIDLKNVPGTLSDYSMIVILQGYLGKEKLMRVRQEWTGNEYKYTKTVKTGAGISRPELERRITKDKFDQLWQQVKYSLSKDRYHVLWEGIDIELNIYCDELDGYHQIEVEFDSNEAALAFVPPAWFGKEVTDDPRHGNFSLAKDGIPK